MMEWVSAKGHDGTHPRSYDYERLLDIQDRYVDRYQVEAPSMLGELMPVDTGELDVELPAQRAREVADWLDEHADDLATFAVDAKLPPADARAAAEWLRWAAQFGAILP